MVSTGRQVRDTGQPENNLIVEELDEEPVPSDRQYLLVETQSSSSSSPSGASERRQVE